MLTKLEGPIPRATELPYVGWCPIGNVVPLPPAASNLAVDFVALCEQRRTQYGDVPLNRAQLSNVLWLAAKALSEVADGDICRQKYKPTISAGAKHPIWLLLLEGLRDDPRAYFYDDELHALRTTALTSSSDCLGAVDQALASCRSADGTLVIFAADWHLTSAKYENPESLLWRDAGALLQQFSLVASAMGLHCVPMGYLGEPLLEQVREGSPLIALGGCLLTVPGQ